MGPVSSASQSESELLLEYVARVRGELFFLSYAPVVALSAKTGVNVRRLFMTIEKVGSMRRAGPARASSIALPRVMESASRLPCAAPTSQIVLRHPAGAAEPKPLSTPGVSPVVNDPRLLPESYASFLRARLRERWEYPGLPILLTQRGRAKTKDAC